MLISPRSLPARPCTSDSRRRPLTRLSLTARMCGNLLERYPNGLNRLGDSRIGEFLIPHSRREKEAAGMVLSDDLRKRVVEAVVLGGLSRNQAAARFKVSIASAVRWVKRFETTGETSPAPSGGDRRSGRIEAHRDYLLGLIRRRPDITLLEIKERLIANCGERFAVSVLWRFFDRHEITFKKNSACRGTTTRGRAKSTPGMVRGAARSRSDETRFH